MAVAPVYGGLPVALHSHLYTAVHSCKGDPDIVHDLVYNNINTRLEASNDNILEAFGLWFEEDTNHDQIRSIRKLSSSGPGPGQVPGQVHKVQGLRTKGLDLG